VIDESWYIKPAFGDLRRFDAANSYPVPNPLNRYVIGSDSKDLKYNADGSLTVYLQSDNLERRAGRSKGTAAMTV
jgi:hypothetical protein